MLSHLTEPVSLDFDILVNDQFHNIVIQVGERRIGLGALLLSLQRRKADELVEHFLSGTLLLSVYVEQILDSLLVSSLFIFQDVEMVI